MISKNTNSEKRYRVVVAAIVGGPFDVARGDILTSEQLGGWRESLLKEGAIELVEEDFEETLPSLKPQTFPG